MTKHLAPAIRADHILDAALTVSRTTGFRNLTREAVAVQAGISPALVSHYYSTMTKLRRSVMRAAIDREVVEIVAEGLAMKDKHALAAPVSLRVRAAAVLVG